jgi:hypothetical protein
VFQPDQARGDIGGEVRAVLSGKGVVGLVLGRGRGTDGDRTSAERLHAAGDLRGEGDGERGLSDGVSQAREIGPGDGRHRRLEAGLADVLAILVGRDAKALGNGQPEREEVAEGRGFRTYQTLAAGQDCVQINDRCRGFPRFRAVGAR